MKKSFITSGLASDLGFHCFPMFHKTETMLKWVNKCIKWQTNSYHCDQRLGYFNIHAKEPLYSNTRGGCSPRVHKIVYLAVIKGNILVNIYIAKICHLSTQLCICLTKFLWVV